MVNQAYSWATYLIYCYNPIVFLNIYMKQDKIGMGCFIGSLKLGQLQVWSMRGWGSSHSSRDQG